MRRRRAFLTIDFIAGLTLGVLALIVFSLAIRQLADAREYADARRMLNYAVQTELNRLRAGLEPQVTPAGDENSTDITLHVERDAPAGDWAPLERVRVTAQKRIRGGRIVAVTMAAYLPHEGDRP